MSSDIDIDCSLLGSHSQEIYNTPGTKMKHTVDVFASAQASSYIPSCMVDDTKVNRSISNPHRPELIPAYDIGIDGHDEHFGIDTPAGKQIHRRVARYIKNRKPTPGRKMRDPGMEADLLYWIAGYVCSKCEFPEKWLVKRKAVELSQDKYFKGSKGWYDKFDKRNRLFINELKDQPIVIVPLPQQCTPRDPSPMKDNTDERMNLRRGRKVLLLDNHNTADDNRESQLGNREEIDDYEYISDLSKPVKRVKHK